MATKLEKLKNAGAGMDKFFSGATEEATESPTEPIKKTTGRNTGKAQEKPIEKPQKVQKKVFSFRAEESLVNSWRVWADAKGMKVDELGEKAIVEYIRKHPLTAEQKTVYDIKINQKNS